MNIHTRLSRFSFSLYLLALAALSCAANSVSNAVTHTTYATVTEALSALDSDGQTIFLGPGTYTEPELVVSYAVTLSGTDAATTILQPSVSPGTASTRVLSVCIPVEFGVTIPVVLENLTLRHGNASGNGGGVYVQEGSLQLCSCIVSNNIANASGGGLGCAYGSDASLAAADCLIVCNTAAGQGGGLLRGSALRCLLRQNRSSFGGGGAYAALDECRLWDNEATSQGGGIFLGSANRSRMARNAAPFGGAAYGAALANSLLLENTAVQNGGGLYAGAATNCTLVANAAGTSGGGVFGAVAVNTIFYGNRAYIGTNSDDTASLSYCCMSPLAAGIGNTNAYPRFRDIDSGDYSLLSHSPCVNAGNDSAAPTGNDLDGNARIQGGAVDMGAYEHDPSVVDHIGFEQWLDRHGLPIDPAAQFGLDHDGDGVPNGFAFAFGTNRIDGALLTVRLTDDGAVAETAVRQTESIGYVDVWAETTGLLADDASWTNAAPVAVGAPDGAARFRRVAADADVRGFFRLKAALP